MLIKSLLAVAVMLTPESLKHLPRYPVTAAVSGSAIAVSALWWFGSDIEGLVMNWQVWGHWELWRAFSSTLPHVNFFHLAFNLYWCWTFGTRIEQAYGHARTAGIILLLAFTSALAEFMLLRGGVGLSGVVYGFWGLLWILERFDPRFAGVVDERTSRTFIIWFFVCIALTLLDIMPVANVAHGVGAGTGALLGLAMCAQGATRWKYCAALATLGAVCLAGATALWPWVNFTKEAVTDLEYAGVTALESGEAATAVKWLETATRMKRAPARAWYNLGVAYQRQRRLDEAVNAFERAAGMADSTPEYRKVAEELRRYAEGQKGHQN